LRRRFAFLPLQPNYAVLRRFQAQYGFDTSGLIAVLEQVNHDIGDANYAVGISFFMRTQLEQELEDLWRMEIEPYLEEYFFDRREVFERFRWSHIAARVQP
jgi:5-methylcytosine-specific restriction protein B